MANPRILRVEQAPSEYPLEPATLAFSPFGVYGEDALCPTKFTAESAGMDLYCVRTDKIMPGETVILPTGLRAFLPKGWFLQIADCSSRARQGLHVLAGTIDADYEGEILVVVSNLNQGQYEYVMLNKHEKFCQVILHRSYIVAPVIADEATFSRMVIPRFSRRGTSGFGHNRPQELVLTRPRKPAGKVNIDPPFPAVSAKCALSSEERERQCNTCDGNQAQSPDYPVDTPPETPPEYSLFAPQGVTNGLDLSQQANPTTFEERETGNPTTSTST